MQTGAYTDTPLPTPIQKIAAASHSAPAHQRSRVQAEKPGCLERALRRSASFQPVGAAKTDAREASGSIFTLVVFRVSATLS